MHTPSFVVSRCLPAALLLVLGCGAKGEPEPGAAEDDPGVDAGAGGAGGAGGGTGGAGGGRPRDEAAGGDASATPRPLDAAVAEDASARPSSDGSPGRPADVSADAGRAPGPDGGRDGAAPAPGSVPPGWDPGAPAAGCGKPGAPGATTRTIVVQGVERSYMVVVPTGYTGDKPWPVVFGFHGNTGTIAHVRGQGVEDAGRGKAIFVYPQGIPYLNAPRDVELGTGNGSTWSLAPAGRDVTLFDALLTTVAGQYCVDKQRVFAWGWSRGGFMASLLGCVRSGVVRAIGPVSSGVPPAIAGAECAPKPSMITHGSMDNELPIARWAIPLRDLWTKVNGCAPTTTPATAPCVAYGCPSEAPVHWCVENGGHGLSRGQAATIWAFFSKL